MLLKGILGCHGILPQKPHSFIFHSTQVNFWAHPQVHMGEMHQLNQDTVLRSKVLLQWSVNVHMVKTLRLKVSYSRVSYRILRLGGGEQDGSRMIVACHACMPTRGIWGMPTQENFDFRSSQIASETRMLFNTCHKTMITILNFNISWGGGDFRPLPSV